jgi:membrane-bound lytic murein transglycosylase D
MARRYKLNPAQVAEWNNMAASAAFKPGQQVVLHLPVRTAVARSAVRVPGKAVVRTSTRAAAPVKARPRAAAHATPAKAKKKHR